MGKRRLRFDVFNEEDQEIGGDMPKKFMRIMRAAANPPLKTSEDKPSNPSFDRVRPGESFADYNSRLSKANKLNQSAAQSAEPKEQLKDELYLKPSLLAALGDVGKKPAKPIRQKRKEYLQKRKEKKLFHTHAKKQQVEQMVHQSTVPRPLRDVVQEPPRLKPNK